MPLTCNVDECKSPDNLIISPCKANYSVMLNADLFGEIGLLLTFKELGQLASAAKFTNEAVKRFYSRRIIRPLEVKIERLRLPLSPRDFQRILVELIASPIFGHSECWIPIMQKLFKHWSFGETMNDLLESHAEIANLIQASDCRFSDKRIFSLAEHLIDYNQLGFDQTSVKLFAVGAQIFQQYTKVEILDPNPGSISAPLL